MKRTSKIISKYLFIILLSRKCYTIISTLLLKLIYNGTVITILNNYNEVVQADYYLPMFCLLRSLYSILWYLGTKSDTDTVLVPEGEPKFQRLSSSNDGVKSQLIPLVY